MAGYTSITPSININTTSGALRTELLNTFARLDGQLTNAPFKLRTTNGPTGNVSNTETTMASFQLNFNTLTEIGQSIMITACGKTAANGNNKTFKLKLGSTTLFDSGALALNDKDWTFRGEIIGNGSASQIFYGEFCSNGSSPVVVTTTGSEDLGTNLTVAFTGTGTTTGDIQQYYYKTILIG